MLENADAWNVEHLMLQLTGVVLEVADAWSVESGMLKIDSTWAYGNVRRGLAGAALRPRLPRPLAPRYFGRASNKCSRPLLRANRLAS